MKNIYVASINEQQLAEFKSVYTNLLPLFREVLGDFTYKLSKLVGSENIQLAFPIQSRLKLWHSIEKKLREGKIHVKKLTNIQDLIGCRVVPLYLDDANSLISLIHKEFEVKKAYNTQEKLSYDQFGYTSTHIIIRPPESEQTMYSSEFKTWQKDYFEDHRPIFNLEIQVRTAAQHIWAETSHQTIYKKSTADKKGMERAMARIAALLELVDLEFQRISEVHSYDRSNSEEDFSFEWIDNRTELKQRVRRVGEVLNEYWPEQCRLENEDYFYIRTQLVAHGIRTETALRRLLERQKYAAIERAFQEAEQLRSDIENFGIENGKVAGFRRYGGSFSMPVSDKLLERLSKNSIISGHVALTVIALDMEFNRPKSYFNLPNDIAL